MYIFFSGYQLNVNVTTFTSAATVRVSNFLVSVNFSLQVILFYGHMGQSPNTYNQIEVKSSLFASNDKLDRKDLNHSISFWQFSLD